MEQGLQNDSNYSEGISALPNSQVQQQNRIPTSNFQPVQQQQQAMINGLNNPSVMVHGMNLLPMVNGVAATSTASNPTHHLLYSPNPFSLFSSPAITPRTTPRSTPVPNAQSSIAAAVAAAAAQFGNNNNNVNGDNQQDSQQASADRDRQLQLAAGLFEQNLRIYGLLGAVTGANNSGANSALFRSPGFGGFSGLASGLGSALVSGTATPCAPRSPARADDKDDKMDDNTNPPVSSSFDHWPAGTASGLVTPQLVSGTTSSGGTEGGPNCSNNNSNSADDNNFQSSSRPDDDKQRCKPSLTLQPANVAEEKA